MALLLMAAILAPAAPAHTGCHAVACRERVARKHCSQARPVPCIRRAAIRWRVSFPMLLRKARCESRMYWGAHNASGASGLFQFLPSTFNTTPYRDRWIYSAKWNALAAGWMHHVGRGGEWSCR